MKTGGQLIVDALKANGVKRVSCVPAKATSPFSTLSMTAASR